MMLWLALLFSIPKTVLVFNILNLDYDVGYALGIGEFAGGILLMLVLTLTATGLPLWKKNYNIATLLGILVLCFGIAVQWVNIFLLIIYVFGLSVGIARFLIGVLSEAGIGR